MIDESHVLTILEAGNEDFQALKKEHEELKVHVYGNNTSKYLTKISGLENKDQIKLRQDHSGTNVSIINSLLSPINKIFKAKGGSRIYDIKSDKVKDDFKVKLSNIKGYSLRQWLKLYWKDKIAADPNGLFMVEKDVDGNPYMTYKSINRIFRYSNENQELKWIVFEPFKIVEEKVKYLVRVVDEIYDYIYLYNEDDKTLTLINKQNVGILLPEIDYKIKSTFGENPISIKHGFNKVPAYIISDIPNTDTGFKLSNISNEFQLLKEYLVDNSVKRIFKFLHGYPVFWKYFSRCETCKGKGHIIHNEVTHNCPECGGTRYSLKKDIGDVIGLVAPETNDEPTIAPNVAGYVSPSIETWKQMIEDLGLLEKAINKSHWGVYDIEITPQTATGEVLRVQSKLDKLYNYSTSFENVETFFTDLLGTYYLKDKYGGSSINLGKRYIIGDTNQILKEYSESKNKKLNDILLNILLEQYFDGEFENDPISYHKAINLMRLEPLVHYTLDEVLNMNVSSEIKKRKTYFNEWVMSKDEDFFMSDFTVYEKDYNTYINKIKDE